MTSLINLITGGGKDVTWIEADAAMLALVEPCLGIICACLPVMRPIFTHIHTTLSTRRSTRRTAKSSQLSSNATNTSNGSNPVPEVIPLRKPIPGRGWMELGTQEEGGFGVDSVFDNEEEVQPRVPEKGIRVTSTVRSESEQARR